MQTGGRQKVLPARETAWVSATGVKLAGRNWATLDDTIVVQPCGGLLRVGERRYRGSLRVFRAEGGSVAVVNDVLIDDYLCGVVPCEIGPINEQTMAAAMAQAVAARSFTISRFGRRPGLGHDLFDSYLRDQEYRGVGAETRLGNEAVRNTAGEVLFCAGAVIEALYHSTCGGQTSQGHQPYLVSVLCAPRPGARAYCADSRYFRWEVIVSRDSLDAVVSRRAGSPRRVRSVRLDKDEGSGRVRRIYFETDRGEVRMSGADFRTALGLRSPNLELSIEPKRVRISGRGWGHGVGMCQEGAIGMARAGATYQQILRHYYPAAELGRLY